MAGIELEHEVGFVCHYNPTRWNYKVPRSIPVSVAELCEALNLVGKERWAQLNSGVAHLSFIITKLDTSWHGCWHPGQVCDQCHVRCCESRCSVTEHCVLIISSPSLLPARLITQIPTPHLLCSVFLLFNRTQVF